jgi:trimeric autotransporter adhesin
MTSPIALEARHSRLKPPRMVSIAVCLLLCAVCGSALAQPTAFNYQGRLTDGTNAATGSYDLQFSLFDAASGGGQQGMTLTSFATVVSNGYFNVALDFGSQFPGADRWLEIGVRSNGGGAYSTLIPRQPITSTPYAITAGNVTGTVAAAQYAVTAGSVSGPVSATLISGVLSNSNLPSSPVFSGSVTVQGSLVTVSNAVFSNGLYVSSGAFNVASNVPVSFVGGAVTFASSGVEFASNAPVTFAGGAVRVDSSGLVMTSGVITVASTVPVSFGSTVTVGGSSVVVSSNGLTAADFWQLEGNAGTSSATNFVGTTDNQALVLKVNGVRALLLEPNTKDQPNLTGGSAQNQIAPLIDGGTIGGGHQNLILPGADYAVVAGGQGNAVGTNSSQTAVGGGSGNIVGTSSENSVIAGGLQNAIGGDSGGSVIGGGVGATIGTNSPRSIIGGGYYNSISNNAESSAIGGGRQNQIDVGSFSSTIAGGEDNTIGTNSMHTAIGGGWNNSVGADSANATIAGGQGNYVLSGSGLSVVGGGGGNGIDANAYANGIVSGQNNYIGAGVQNSFIGGGYQNYIRNQATYGTIGGGSANQIDGPSLATVAGGFGNTIAVGSDWAAIGGGGGNTISSNAAYASISAGYQNAVRFGSAASAVSGGGFNVISSNASYASISGGLQNDVGHYSSYSTVGGGGDNHILDFAAYATIPGGAMNTAGGLFAFAAGQRAKATNTGSFVWADSRSSDFASTNNDSFSVRSVGGVRFVSAVNEAGTPTAGVQLAAGGGAWTTLSDRHSKENFEPVDAKAVLERVLALPVSRWNYKTQAKSVRHIGPTAQDFAAAFSVGESETGITTVDADGVALAAIQGLNLKLEETRQALKSREAENAELKDRLDRLEGLLNANTPGAR